MKQQTCKERLDGELKDRLADIRILWRLYRRDAEASHPELGSFNEYGLSFDYVPKGTFSDQKRGYFCWQLSWGGPADEFRFYVDEELDVTEIEYWFLDWYDGAGKLLTGDDFKLLDEIYQDFKDLGIVNAERAKSMNG